MSTIPPTNLHRSDATAPITIIQRAPILNRPAIPSPLANASAIASLPTHTGVAENGAFDFDRVIKAGALLKRRKRTKVWRQAYVVLRPNVLSIYNDLEGTRLRHKINLCDVTAAALRRDKVGKHRHEGLFGVFTLTRNFHLEAESDEAAAQWVDSIRKETCLDEDPRHDTSPNNGPAYQQHSLPSHLPYVIVTSNISGCGTMSASTEDAVASDSIVSGSAAFASVWDTYDGTPTRHSSVDSLPAINQLWYAGSPPDTGSDPFHKVQILPNELNRVIWQGYLQYRLSSRCVRAWNKYWVVLRHQNLALYRGEDEYAASLLVPLANIIDIVETESTTKKRAFGMQLITNDMTYRFCAADEDDMSVWMGRIKSALARREEIAS